MFLSAMNWLMDLYLVHIMVPLNHLILRFVKQTSQYENLEKKPGNTVYRHRSITPIIYSVYKPLNMQFLTGFFRCTDPGLRRRAFSRKGWHMDHLERTVFERSQ